jgi:hypothetical protein
MGSGFGLGTKLFLSQHTVKYDRFEQPGLPFKLLHQGHSAGINRRRTAGRATTTAGAAARGGENPGVSSLDVVVGNVAAVLGLVPHIRGFYGGTRGLAADADVGTVGVGAHDGSAGARRAAAVELGFGGVGGGEAREEGGEEEKSVHFVNGCFEVGSFCLENCCFLLRMLLMRMRFVSAMEMVIYIPFPFLMNSPGLWLENPNSFSIASSNITASPSRIHPGGRPWPTPNITTNHSTSRMRMCTRTKPCKQLSLPRIGEEICSRPSKRHGHRLIRFRNHGIGPVVTHIHGGEAETGPGGENECGGFISR